MGKREQRCAGIYQTRAGIERAGIERQVPRRCLDSRQVPRRCLDSTRTSPSLVPRPCARSLGLAQPRRRLPATCRPLSCSNSPQAMSARSDMTLRRTPSTGSAAATDRVEPRKLKELTDLLCQIACWQECFIAHLYTQRVIGKFPSGGAPPPGGAPASAAINEAFSLATEAHRSAARLLRPAVDRVLEWVTALNHAQLDDYLVLLGSQLRAVAASSGVKDDQVNPLTIWMQPIDDKMYLELEQYVEWDEWWSVIARSQNAARDIVLILSHWQAIWCAETWQWSEVHLAGGKYRPRKRRPRKLCQPNVFSCASVMYSAPSGDTCSS